MIIIETKRKVLIIYTGGTIGMLPSPQGYIPVAGMFTQVMQSIPAFSHADLPEWSLLEFDPLLDSSDITYFEWNKIGKTISDNYEKYDGFVVLHGTDTMAYSASALSFMLENLAKPVIFTGSQIPLCELRSDGEMNLINAISIAASEKVQEVCLYFDGKLLRGNRSTKMSSDRFSAFESPNAPHLANVGIEINYNDNVICSVKSAAFNFRELVEAHIAVLKVFPGIQFELFSGIFTKQLRGVILETFGAGNIPSYATSLLSLLKTASCNGTGIAACAQCTQGAVNLGTYAVSRPLLDVGVVNGQDMTTEAAITKLHYLFSCDLTSDQIKCEMEHNLRGELTEPTLEHYA